MANKKGQSLKESIQALTKTAGKPITIQNPKNHTTKDGKIDRRQFNKRTPGTGNPPKEITLLRRGIKAFMEQHSNEKIDVKITDPKTGQTRTIKKPRAMVLLEVLFAKAYTDKDVAAIKEWFDRAVGKSAQPIRGDGDDDTPIRMEIDITKILQKAYENEN